MAREFFDKHNIRYTDHNVSGNFSRAKEMISRSGQTGVPVIIIRKDGQEDVVVGFDQEYLQKAVLSGAPGREP